MSEDFFNEYKAQRRAKREQNRQRSPQILRDEGIAFKELNNGLHLRIEGYPYCIDFWPGTGLWHVYKPGVRDEGRGVGNLVKYLKDLDNAKT